ncbi:putative N-formylglutamate amidohydrolase [Roseovarius sp. MBR-79]|jgi:predicted N-formylglutamate amidohydrolase
MTGTAENPVEILNPHGRGAAILVCEHASNHIPDAYRGLGLDAAARFSHAAWDPGALALAQLLSQALDAPLVAGRISRLVYDCNRPPDAPSAMPEQSETIAVPGNRGLDATARAARAKAVYEPFTKALTEVIAARQTPAALVTVHSFSPTWFGTPRAVELGILHDADARLADLMLSGAPALPARRIARNAPYGPEDGVTHTLRLHGLANDLPNVMLEVRQDLLTTEQAQRQMADEILILLRPALAALGLGEAQDA